MFIKTIGTNIEKIYLTPFLAFPLFSTRKNKKIRSVANSCKKLIGK
jgi:hypothetical protein